MGFFSKKDAPVHEKGTPDSHSPADTPARRTSDPHVHGNIEEPTGRVPTLAILLGAIASIGGFMFGYESGQISGTLLSLLIAVVRF
jgi:SP family sugar:H+ symporter-like MFS transporter